MRVTTILCILGMAAVGHPQSVCLFQPDEKAKVLAFWRAPDRYYCSIPPSAMTDGIWQVRLTVAGSQWLWNHQGGKKNPLLNPSSANPWEKWINAKLARDRWEALQAARDANEAMVGVRLPYVDKQIPEQEPPMPGPMPDGLQEHSGVPPRFAEIVMPMRHQVRFDDAQFTYLDNPRLSNPRYPYYRSEVGVLSGGTPARAVPDAQLSQYCSIAGIGDVEAHVMRAVSLHEGGFDAVNTYDTGFVSVGFIQFASCSTGGAALGGLLKAYKDANPAAFQKDFKRYGVDVTANGVLQVLDLSSGQELTGPAANREIIRDKRLIAVFQHAGAMSPTFIAMQLRAARDMYLPSNDPIAVQVGDRTLTGVVGDFVKSEAGLAILMDRKVNTGRLDPLPAIVKALAAELDIKSLSELAPYERDIVAQAKYRKDYLADDTLAQPGPSPRSNGDLMSRGTSSSRSRRRGR